MNPNHYTPIYQIDRFTFCTYLFKACLDKNHVTPDKKALFVRDCAKRFPTTVDEFVTLENGVKYGWEFNGDYLVAQEHKIASSRNFTVWTREGAVTEKFDAGPKVLKKVADDFSNDKCNYFGGTPGMQVVDEAALADDPLPTSPLFSALSDQDVGFWGGLLIGGGFLVSEIIGFFFAPKIPAGAFGGMFGTDPHDHFGYKNNIL